MYCFDILTDTYGGIGYALGTWNGANVPNVGYVARILSEYYPYVPAQPSGLANTDQMAASVQAAVWFFSDRYVLATSDPLRPTVAAIVAHIIDEGPVTQPSPPSLDITPTNASGLSTESVVGPFTVTSATGEATVLATGGEMFADASANTPIPDNSSVPTPAQIWLTSTGQVSAVLQATASAKVPKQNVYLYDGNSNGVVDAQKLILALDGQLTTTVTATAEFKPVGSLTVTKTIAGPAARQQGQVVISTVCDGGALTPDFVIASGTPAGSSSRTYTSIPAGSICTVTETADGQTSSLAPVEVTGNGDQVTIAPGGTATAHITDTYSLVPGSLEVTKAITGEGAALRGAIVIGVVCDGTALPSYIIAPSTNPSDVQPMHYDGIPAGASCIVAELAIGSNTFVTATVSASVDGSAVTLPATVTVRSGSVVAVNVADDYNFNTGNLVVTKTIAGSAAGQQGQVTVAVACDGVPPADTPPFVIPAATPPGSVSHTYSDLPGETRSAVTETADGSTATVAAEVDIPDGEPTVPAGGTVTTSITDTYTASGLAVNKAIAGDGAGQQGAVTITVACDGVPAADTPPFVIPAGTSAGEISSLYTAIPLGSSCTVTETGDGATPAVTVVTTGSPTTVSVDPVAEVDITDTYSSAPGSLTVTKTIAGPAAGRQGAVTIAVSCAGVPPSDTPALQIPPEATGSVSHTYSDLPAGSQCSVSETADGSTATVAVRVSPRVQTATVTAGETESAAVTDTYSLLPGSILLGKTIAGPSAGEQGPITVAATCGGTALPTFVIPAGAPAGMMTHTFDGIAAGSSCTVSETEDGATSSVTATVLQGGAQTVTVPAGTVVPVSLTDVFSDSPGTLTVTKDIAGTAAGDQAQIAILVDCGEPSDQYALLIPGGAPAGSISRTFAAVPAGSSCTITETASGATSTVSVAQAGSGQTVSVDAAQRSSAQLTDTFTPVGSTTTTGALALTGASPPTLFLLELAAATIASGGILAAMSRRPRYRRLHARKVDHR